jgi:hypothetical protein
MGSVKRFFSIIIASFFALLSLLGCKTASSIISSWFFLECFFLRLFRGDFLIALVFLTLGDLGYLAGFGTFLEDLPFF